MVPFFYDQGIITDPASAIFETDQVTGRERIQELLRTRPESFGFLDVGHFQEKVNE